MPGLEEHVLASGKKKPGRPKGSTKKQSTKKPAAKKPAAKKPKTKKPAAKKPKTKKPSTKKSVGRPKGSTKGKGLESHVLASGRGGASKLASGVKGGDVLKSITGIAKSLAPLAPLLLALGKKKGKKGGAIFTDIGSVLDNIF